ncbi:uncharacterized protein LOC111050850 [Nilaparvata lugens]|uniref:uncharacterized protein LOC111050850 n=1 Tax=Nilaparvata lugens TaxID=108931 RepID=UPI00193D9674|nr:uncharacterized protein LOC111050850 [Nilaparvata lugens]
MKCHFLTSLIINCLLLRCVSSFPFSQENNLSSKNHEELDPEDENSANTSLTRLLQQNSEFIGQDLLRNILGLKVFNRASVSSTEKGLTELTNDETLENEEIDDLNPVKIMDDSKYISGSYESRDTIGPSDEIVGNPAGYFEKIPKIRNKSKASKKSEGKLNSVSRKKTKSFQSPRIFSDSKAGREMTTDDTSFITDDTSSITKNTSLITKNTSLVSNNTSLDDGHVLMVLDATNNNTQLDPLYVVIQSKDGNLTSVINNNIFKTRAKLFDLINKIDCHNKSTVAPSTTTINNEGCDGPTHSTRKIQTFENKNCETSTEEITEKTHSTRNTCKVPDDQILDPVPSEPTVDKHRQTTSSHCEDDIGLKPMFLKVYVPLSVQLEPLLASGRKQYVIKSISIDNSNDYKSIFGSDQYEV